MSTDTIRNARRYLIVAISCLVLAAAYFGSGVLSIGALMVPGLVVSVALVSFIPRRWPTAAARLAAVVMSTCGSFVVIAVTQSAVRTGPAIDPSVDPWSPTYAVTFLAAFAGFIFGCLAILPRRGTAHWLG